MAQFRLSPRAQADLAHILAESREKWGVEASRRYAAILEAAMLKIVAAPESAVTRARNELAPGVRSFHIKYVRQEPGAKVKTPVHIVYFRALGPDLIEIVRVLHERMDPTPHVQLAPRPKSSRRRR